MVMMMMMMAGAALPLLVAGQGGQEECFPGEGPIVHYPPTPSITPPVARFSYALFDSISRQQGEKSVIFSPYSVWSVLTLAYFGALGTTQTEIENALAFPNKTHTLSSWLNLRYYLENGAGEARLRVANRGYFSDSLQINSCLQSNVFDIQLIDFTRASEARRTINQDVSTTTEGLIPELISFLPSTTRFALINAIYFKGTWETQFNPQHTRRQQFMVPPGRSSGVVRMMNRNGTMRAGEVPVLDAKMVELPYEGSNVSMFLVLPNDELAPTTTTTTLLNPTTFAQALDALPQDPVPVSLSVPRFKLTSRFEDDLMIALESLGIHSLFDAQRSDLRGFTRQQQLSVDTTIHQATVEVNEEGTVAAAATAFIHTRIGPQKPLELVFNRPFVFLVVEKITKIPLFIGKVTSAKDLTQ